MSPERLDEANPPIAALLSRYMKRRSLSCAEAGRQLDRDEGAVRALLNGRTTGQQPSKGEPPLLGRLIALLEIPDREWRRAVADQLQWDMIYAIKWAKRASSRRYAQTGADQYDFALAGNF